MLKQDHIERARRFAGVAALAILCAGSGVTAWASQPAQVRLARAPANGPYAERAALDGQPIQLAQLQAQRPQETGPEPSATQPLRTSPASSPAATQHPEHRAKACWAGRYGCAPEGRWTDSSGRPVVSDANTTYINPHALVQNPLFTFTVPH